MSEQQPDPEGQKARIRAALDLLENYVGKDGKIDATKLTSELLALRRPLAKANADRDALRDALDHMQKRTGNVDL
jgi:hypothetical protein